VVSGVNIDVSVASLALPVVSALVPVVAFGNEVWLVVTGAPSCGTALRQVDDRAHSHRRHLSDRCLLRRDGAMIDG
jgi:hypothetical protein